MIEQLAQLAHNQWSGWMKHLFRKGVFNDDGTWTMPKWAVERWTQQMNIKYRDLTEKEKKSDHEEAEGMLKIMNSGTSKDTQVPKTIY